MFEKNYIKNKTSRKWTKKTKDENKISGKWSDLAHSKKFKKDLYRNKFVFFPQKKKKKIKNIFRKQKSLKTFTKYKHLLKDLQKTKISKKLIEERILLFYRYYSKYSLFSIGN